MMWPVLALGLVVHGFHVLGLVALVVRDLGLVVFAAGRDEQQQGSHGGEEDWDGQPRGKDGEGNDTGGAPSTALGGEPPRLYGLHA